MYCIESIWKTSKRSAGFTNWWPEHHTAYDHFKCSCLRWVCLTAILINSVTKSPWRNCCDYEQRPFSWVLGSQAVDTTPPPPPTLLSWAWVASLATISWLSSTPIMLTISLYILQLVDIYCLTIRLTNRLSIIVFCHKVSLVTVLFYENVVNTGSKFKHAPPCFIFFDSTHVRFIDSYLVDVLLKTPSVIINDIVMWVFAL